MTIDLKYCSHNGLKGHLVPREQMTWIHTKAGKRAICTDCKAARVDGLGRLEIYSFLVYYFSMMRLYSLLPLLATAL